MEVIELLEYLQELIDTSQRFFSPNKIIINKKEIMDVIDKIINIMPDEFKKAQYICDQRDKILSEAVQQAEILKKEKMALLRHEIENHDIIREAQDKADRIMNSAQKNAKDLRLGARDYADQLLEQLQKEINNNTENVINNLQVEFSKFIDSMSKEVNTNNRTLRDNIKELRNMK